MALPGKNLISEKEIFDYSNLDTDILSAIIYVESKGNPQAYAPGEDAVGILQIRKCMVDDVNRILKRKKSPIRESLGSASKATGNFKNTKNPIVETDPMVERFKKLAGLK